MNLPIIMECDATECVYNNRLQCHAAAITVGNGVTPHCDTFFVASGKGGIQDVRGEVGACRVSGCRYNKAFECTAADGIRVGHRGHEVDCLTFATT